MRRTGGPVASLALAMAQVGCGGSGSDASEGADASLSLPEPSQGVQLQTERGTVPAGEAREWCQVFQVPGTPVETFRISALDLESMPYLHHAVVALIDPDDDADVQVGDRRECVGAESLYGERARPVFGAASSSVSVDYAGRMTLEVLGGQKLVIDAHYINATARVIPTQEVLNITFGAPSVQFARPLVLEGPAGDLPPQTRREFDARCTFQAPLFLLELRRPTLIHATTFRVWHDGADAGTELLWQSANSEFDASRSFESPHEIAVGESLRFECTFENPTSETLRAGTDVICNLLGTYAVTTEGGAVDLGGCVALP